MRHNLQCVRKCAAGRAAQDVGLDCVKDQILVVVHEFVLTPAISQPALAACFATVSTDLVVARIYEGSAKWHLQIGSLNPVEVDGKTSAPTWRLLENEAGTIHTCSFKFAQFFDAATETRWANRLSGVVERRERFFLRGASRELEL
jgi:hypothetical protein